ncbi:hypothetical protein S40288_10344, partial [Stachybotrys chartarum IBT 40288]
ARGWQPNRNISKAAILLDAFHLTNFYNHLTVISASLAPGAGRMRRLWEHARRRRGSSNQSDSSTSASQPLPATPSTPQGLEVVSDGNDAIIDIVAVHGLNGHRQKTWTATNNVHWLRDLLPHDLPRARIMSWGYDANTHDSSRVSCQYLYDYARNLVSDLCLKRQLTNQQLGQYGPISNDFVTKYVYEEYETATAFGHEIMVVPCASAVVPGHANAESIVIHNDHINMVKFVLKEDSGYEKISGYLQIMVANAGEQIRLRWEEEARITEAWTDTAFGRWFLPLSLSGVIEVTHFVAREEELARIHEMLRADDERRAAIVHGLGGMDDAALKIAQRLDGLPLALSTAGSYLSQVSTSCAEYLELYNKSWLRLQKASPKLLTYDYAMYTTWDISYRHIERDDKNAAKLLRLWAYFDNEDLWFKLLQSDGLGAQDWLQQATQDRLSFDQTMRILCSHGLVEADPPTRKWGRLKDAEDMYNRALQGYEKAWGSEHTSTLDTVNNLASLYADQGQFKDAEDIYNRALQGYEKAWGPEHISMLNTVNNLGLLYKAQGRFKDAEDIYNRALQGYEKAWGPEHTSTLNTVNNLGLLYADQGRFKDAENMYNRALQGYEKALRVPMVNTYPPALNTMENLGDLLRKVGRLKEAQIYYLCAEGGVRLVYGSESERHQRLSSKLQPHD